MNGDARSTQWPAALRWLAELIQPTTCTPPAGVGHPTVTTVRSMGARLAFAVQLEQVEAIGIDMVHAAVNELLAMHALPQAASLSVAGRRDGGIAIGVVAGIVRACNAHDVPLTVSLAVEADEEQVGLLVGGSVLKAPPLDPAPGFSVLALRGTGPTDGDIGFLLAVAAERGLPLQACLTNGDSIARALAAPRASHASVMYDPLRLGWWFVGGAIDAVGLRGRLRTMLPAELDVQLDFAGMRPPAPFSEWFVGPDRLCSAAVASSVGHDFLVVVPRDETEKWVQHFAAWGEPAARIGVLVVRSPLA